MKIQDFNSFKDSQLTLKYFILDWDDNILHMSTPIHIDQLIEDEWKPVDITPEEFAKIRKSDNWKNRNDNVKLTFQEFRDTGPRGNKAFLEDAKKAVLNGDFGPSFKDFINTLINGNIFLIITARGHEPETMKHFVKWLICNYMTPKQRDKMLKNLQKFQKLFKSEDVSIRSYLDTCEFVGIMSEYFKNIYGKDLESDNNVEKGKEIVVNDFLHRLEKFATQVGAKLKVGFSDDDESTVKHMTDFFKEKDLDVAVDYYIFDTSNKGKERVKI